MDFKKLNCLVDLHLHLDGSLSLPSLRELAGICGKEIPEKDEDLKKAVAVDDTCESLNDYLEKFDFPLELLQSPETVKKAVCNLFTEIYKDGVMYAEVRFAPQLHGRCGMSQRETVKAACEGLSESGVPGGLILCMMRGNKNQKENRETIEVAKEFYGKGVCALDLAGAEALFPTETFAEEFALIRESGIPYTIHAGEAAGAESVKAALSFGARRIGHGVRSEEDPVVLSELSGKKIPLEMCPQSNLDTKTVEKLSAYPLKKYLLAGIPVTVNTDNMAVSDTTLREELQKITEALSLSDREVFLILRNSVLAAFTDEKTRAELLAKIEETEAGM